jgi:hypothetical protein
MPMDRTDRPVPPAGAALSAANRPGFALAGALLALVVIGAIVTGGFFAASQEGRVGDSTRYAGEAFYLAEAGIQEAVGTVSNADYNALAMNGESTLSGQVEAPGGAALGTYDVTIRRIGGRIFFVRSTGTVTRGGRYGGASRTMGLVVRTRSMDIDANQAVRAFGRLQVGGNSTVSGTDTRPSNWSDCGPLDVERTGVEARDTSLVTIGGSGVITGDPPKQQDPTMTAEDFLVFGDVTYDDLAAAADKVFNPGYGAITNTGPEVSSGNCNTSVLTNWGAPTVPGNACHLYFPIIHLRGETTSWNITSSSNGQGILLVDGDLRIAGGFEFYGIVIVKGKFETGSGSSRVNGTVFIYTEGALDEQSTMTGTPVVQRSTCAVERAILYNGATARAAPLVQRSWMDLSNVQTGS